MNINKLKLLHFFLLVTCLFFSKTSLAICFPAGGSSEISAVKTPGGTVLIVARLYSYTSVGGGTCIDEYDWIRVFQEKTNSPTATETKQVQVVYDPDTADIMFYCHFGYCVVQATHTWKPEDDDATSDGPHSFDFYWDS